jgi:hypothetical protein
MKQKFKKSLLAVAVSAIMTSGAMAQNIGFEDGTATGWSGNGISAVGTQTLQAGQNQWTVNPYGSYMGKLTISNGSFSQMTSALSLTSTSASGIQSTLSTQAQLTGNGGGNPTTASWASKTVTLTAGQTFTLAWQYISTDYVPFNDGSIATLVKVGSPTTTAVLNNYSSQYALLGFTNPGTGDYSTGSYGATGWQTATYSVTESGDYLLGFGVFNLDDTALSPVLYVDEVTGTTLKNGQTFGAVAPNPGTSAPDTSSGSITPPPPPPPPPGPTLISNVTGTTGSDVLATGSITVNGGTIQIMMTGATLTQLFDVQAGGMTVDQNSNSATLSGVISGTGDVVIANSGTGGSITFTAVNTYTGSTTVNTGATLINDGSIALSGGITNNGTFTNNGQASNVTNNNTFTNSSTGTIANLVNNNTATNDGTITGTVTNNSTATFTNNSTGTTGAVSNAGIVNNFGTISSVASNSGTFNNFNIVTSNVTNSNIFNNGTSSSSVGISVGNVFNSGTFNNYATTGGIINLNTFNNNGTTGSVNNAGTFINNNTTGSVSNDGTFTNVGTTGDVTNTGTFTNNGIVSTVNTNQGTFNNNVTAGQVLNEGTFNNAGTTSDVINAGTFNNSGSTGPVTNQGTFNLTGNGTVTSIVNDGTVQAPAVFNATGANSDVTVSGYSQNAFGSTIINGNQKIIVNGNASVAGDLQIVDAPTAYGKHTYLTAGSITGKYNTLTLNPDLYPLGYGLVYTGNTVALKVTPSATYTQNSINQTATSLSSVTNLQMASLGGSLGYDCNVYGDNNICMSVGARVTADGSNNLSAASLVLGYRVSPNWRIGVFGNQPTNNLTVGNVTMKNTQPLLGGFVNWNNNADGTGLGVQTSLAMNTANLSIQRVGTQYSEAGKGTTSSNGQAFQVKTTYNQPLTESTSITPYAGLRYTQLTTNGYTETGAVYPLTYNSINQNATDAIAGVTLGHNFTNRLAGFVSAGVVQNLSYSAGTISGTSDIINLNKFNSQMSGQGYTSPTVGFGASYALSKNEYLGLSVGWQERSMLNVNVKSGTITYTVGF